MSNTVVSNYPSALETRRALQNSTVIWWFTHIMHSNGLEKMSAVTKLFKENPDATVITLDAGDVSADTGWAWFASLPPSCRGELVNGFPIRNASRETAVLRILGVLRDHGILVPNDFEHDMWCSPDWLQSTQLFKYIISTEDMDTDILKVHLGVALQYQ